MTVHATILTTLVISYIYIYIYYSSIYCSKNLQEKEKQAVHNLEKVRESLNTECQELQLRLQSVNRQLAEETHKSQVVSEQ